MEIAIISYLFHLLIQGRENTSIVPIPDFLKKNNLTKEELKRYLTPYTQVSNNPELVYELKPNLSINWYGEIYKVEEPIVIKINSNGFRDREYLVKETNNTFRIISLGDSFTFGFGIQLNETYSKVLEKKLNSNSSKKFEVLNFGVPGYNLEQKIEFFKEKGLKYDPDMILLQYLSDDILEVYRFQKVWWKKIKDSKNVNKANYGTENLIRDEILSKSYTETSKIVEKSFHKLRNLTHNRNITIVILFWYQPPENQLKVIKKVTEEYGWHVLNVGDFLKGKEPSQLRLPDGHPNALANKIVGEGIYTYLSQELNEIPTK
jgi:lysophospholipase L1-like esterase